MEILIIMKDERLMSWQSGQDNESLLFKRRSNGRMGLGVHLQNEGNVDSSPNELTCTDHHGSGRRSLSETSGNGLSLRKQFHREEDSSLNHNLRKAQEDGGISMRVNILTFKITSEEFLNCFFTTQVLISLIILFLVFQSVRLYGRRFSVLTDVYPFSRFISLSLTSLLS